MAPGFEARQSRAALTTLQRRRTWRSIGEQTYHDFGVRDTSFGVRIPDVQRAFEHSKKNRATTATKDPKTVYRGKWKHSGGGGVNLLPRLYEVLLLRVEAAEDTEPTQYAASTG